ncbi:hydrogen peroxide-inducible genes activator [Henriciella sp.]|uniref:hydrogen peroxide-inducible genes activator n=1 Tax=Henriciella sp. TaxID=1968823 RepID=UPI00261472D6|nr:hydrogen peroxide-inducible genes activator [Henriciella sp.]
MRPTLRQLQYIVAIADCGRFHEAAKRLHVSQPSLSAQLAEAEADLGVIVFERGRKGASPTPVGEDIIRQARLILSEVEELRTLALGAKNTVAGRIRLGVLPSIGPYLLPSVTRQLHDRFPDLRLNVRECDTVELDQGLRDGRFDIIISTPDDHADQRAETLFEEKLWVCGPPEDLLAIDGGPIQLGQLASRPLLTLGAGHRLSKLIAEIAREAGTTISAEYEGSSLDAARQMAVMGAGYAILPSLYALSEAKRDPDFVVREIDNTLCQRTIALVWRPTSPLEKEFGVLADLMKSVAADFLGRH